MKYTLFVLVLTIFNHFCAGQVKGRQVAHYTDINTIKPLMIDDPVPDFELANVRNWPSKKIKISDLKGKVVILDFWSKNCIACIRGFPKMDELQEKYKDKIQILLVTYNSYRELESLFQRSKPIKNTKLPIILSDTILHKLFPNEGLPYYVWMDEKQNTIAKTWGSHVTAEYIDRVLKGEKLPKKIMKEETLMDFDSQAPMVTEGGGRQWKYLAYYSMIMKRVGNIQKAISGPIQNPVTKDYVDGSFYATNLPMLALYRGAYGAKEINPVVIEVANAIRYYRPKNPDDYIEWEDNYSFCYEQVLPRDKIQLRDLILQRDLEQFFGLSATKEQRLRKCLVLYRIDTIDRLKSKFTNETIDSDNDSLNSVLKYRYTTIDRLKTVLINKYKFDYDQPVIIDETGYTEHIDIHLTTDISDLQKLREELRKFGLEIRTENRPVECLILTKNAFWIEPGRAK